MAENPKVTIFSEVERCLVAGDFENAYEILRHEGAKKGVEHLLYTAGAHEIGRLALRYLVGGRPVDDPLLYTNVAGLALDGPIGLNPGWDKTGKTIQAWQALGAHHTTPGGVPFFPQTGRRMPRLTTFNDRLGDHGVNLSLNSMKFPSPGAEVVRYNIEKQKEQGDVHIPIIVQLTMNHVFFDDPKYHHLIHDLMRMTAEELLPVADAFNIGLTSPNVDYMRKVQAGDKADEFVRRIINAIREVTASSDRYIPIIFKGHGDLGERQWEYYCNWATYNEDYFDAFELINTTRKPEIWAKHGLDPDKVIGGLAGSDPDFQQLALDATRYVYEAIGDRFDIITNGGIDSGRQLVLALENGGSAVGINSAIPKLGLGAMKLIEREGLAILKRKYPEATSLDQIIGIATARKAKYLTRENPADKAENAARRIKERT